MIKKIIFLLITLTFTNLTVFAEDEFSDDADIDYSYNEDYDEFRDTEEITSDSFDSSESFYDPDYDELSDYDDEPSIYYEEEYAYADDDYPSDDGITVYIDNKKVSFDVEPMIINDRTMVPMRAIFEALGADVTWNDASKTAKGVLGGTTVEITIGAGYIVKNGQSTYIDTPATVVSGRTLVPVRAIAASFDCNVNWDAAKQRVDISQF